MAFCLIPKIADEFVKRLRSGEIDPEKLNHMTSEERRGFFSSFMGDENAKNTNALFESKLLLKNQQTGIINWAKQVSGIKNEVRSDIISRVNKLERALSPEDEKNFLSDLAEQKLGMGVTKEEAAKISELAKKTSIAKEAALNGGDRLAYGKSLVEFQNYMRDLKNEATGFSLGELKTNPLGTLWKGTKEAAGLAKSMKVSLQAAFVWRHGFKVAFTHPEIWLKNTAKAFKTAFDALGGKDGLDAVQADILSRPNSLNGLYKKEGVAIGTTEEALPTHIHEKIPALGRIFKASDQSFIAFQHLARADVFDKLVDIVKKTGGDIKGLGRIANTLVDRGNLGALEKYAGGINIALFSPRFLKSNLDILTGQALDYGNLGSFARKQAAINTLKVVSGIAGVLTMANLVRPGSVERDPRSSDFGKIRIGNTRYEIAGGLPALVTLASRLMANSTKSSTTGEVKELNTGNFGSPTSGDVIENFTTNHFSPAFSIAKDLLNRKDREGNPITITGELKNAFMPIAGDQAMDLYNSDKKADALAAIILGELGVGSRTYSKKEKTSKVVSKK